MNKEEKLEVVFKEFRREIFYWTKDATKTILGKSTLKDIPYERDYIILGNYLNDDKAIAAFENVMKVTTKYILEAILHRIDSSISIDPLLNVDFVDRDTGESLRPENGSYDGDFSYMMYEAGLEEGIEE